MWRPGVVVVVVDDVVLREDDDKINGLTLWMYSTAGVQCISLFSSCGGLGLFSAFLFVSFR